MVAGGFLVKELVTSEESKEAFPDDIGSPPPEHTAKNIFIFHDESTFNANDDESLQWGGPESQVIRPKSRGSSIMVSDLITENEDYLCLPPSEYDAMKQSNPSICMGLIVLYFFHITRLTMSLSHYGMSYCKPTKIE